MPGLRSTLCLRRTCREYWTSLVLVATAVVAAVEPVCRGVTDWGYRWTRE